MNADPARPTRWARRYGQRQALADCTLEIPPGHVVGLVGPNGAGKTTLLKIACGMLAPTTGRIDVLGEQPAAGPAQLARVGYVAQDTPTYASLSVADHLKLGAKLNPRWDAKLATARIDAARPRPEAEGRQALRRPARPARPDRRRRQAARTAHPRRAGRQPRPARPPRLPAAPDGVGRRARHQRHPLLAPGLRPRTRLRLPGRARLLPRPARRRDRRPARRSTTGSCAPAATPTDLPAGLEVDLGRAHRPAVHLHRAQRRRPAGRGLVRRTRSAWKTSS